MNMIVWALVVVVGVAGVCYLALVALAYWSLDEEAKR